MTARVLIVEDHALVAIGLQLALSARGWEVETTDGPTAAAVIDHARRFEPQVVLCDINLGEGIGSGIDLVAPLRASGAEVVVLTAETRPGVLASCLGAGAAGWVGKHALLDEVVAALNDVLAGTPLIGCAAREAMIDELRIERAGMRKALTPFEQLTMRERDVLAALVDGLSAEEIADSQYVALHSALPDSGRAPKARRALTVGRRRPRQPGWLEARAPRARGGLTRRASPHIADCCRFHQR